MDDVAGLIELAALARKYNGPRYRKVLQCAQDISNVLIRKYGAPAAKRLPWEPDISLLTGIDVIVIPHYEPGQWKLIQHDHCEVIGGEHPEYAMIETHEHCTVLGENPGPGTGELAGFGPGTGRSSRDDWGGITGYLVTGREPHLTEFMISTAHFANWLESRPTHPGTDNSDVTAYVMVMDDCGGDFLEMARYLNGLPREDRVRTLTVEKVTGSGEDEDYELLIGEPGTGWVPSAG